MENRFRRKSVLNEEEDVMGVPEGEGKMEDKAQTRKRLRFNRAMDIALMQSVIEHGAHVPSYGQAAIRFEAVAKALEKMSEFGPGKDVTWKATRDRFQLLIRNFQEGVKEEMKPGVTGGSSDDSDDLKKLIGAILMQMDEATGEKGEKRMGGKGEDEKSAAMEHKSKKSRRVRIKKREKMSGELEEAVAAQRETKRLKPSSPDAENVSGASRPGGESPPEDSEGIKGGGSGVGGGGGGMRSTLQVPAHFVDERWLQLEQERLEFEKRRWEAELERMGMEKERAALEKEERNGLINLLIVLVKKLDKVD